MEIKIISEYENIKEVFLEGESLLKYDSEDNSREVFIGDSYVFKANIKDEEFIGKRQCFSEFERYKQMEESDKSLFTPIIEYGIIQEWEYVIAPKINFKIIDNPIILKHKDWDYLIDALLRNHIGDVWNGFNCGITDKGKLYCYDYGL